MATPVIDITAEVHFAQRLAANDKKTRDRAVRRLKKWIEAKSASENDFTEDDLLKVWKGLFYCMWMSDKPLIQEELSKSICQLLSSFQTEASAFLFIDTFFTTMAREWYGIDRWRMDKFMMMIRTFLHQCLEYLQKLQWQKEYIEKFSNILRKIPLSSDQTAISVPLGLQLHVTDIFVEEVARMVSPQMTPELANSLLEPYCLLLVETKDPTLLKNIVYRVFEFAMRISDIDVDGEEDEDSAGDEQASVEDEQNHIEGEDNDSAGIENSPETTLENTGKRKKKKKAKVERVSYRRLVDTKTREAMEMPYIKFEYTMLADKLFKLASQPHVKHRNRVVTYRLVNKFRDLANGVFPLDRHFPKAGVPLTRDDIEEAAMRLNEDDEKVHKEKLERKRKKNKRTLKEESEDDSDLLEDDDDELEPLLDDDGETLAAKNTISSTFDADVKSKKNKMKKLKECYSKKVPENISRNDEMPSAESTAKSEVDVNSDSIHVMPVKDLIQAPVKCAETFKQHAFDEAKVDSDLVAFIDVQREKRKAKRLKTKLRKSQKGQLSISIVSASSDDDIISKKVTKVKPDAKDGSARFGIKRKKAGLVDANFKRSKKSLNVSSSKKIKGSRPEKAIVHIESEEGPKSIEKMWKRPPAFLHNVVTKLGFKTKDKKKKEVKKKKFPRRQKFQVSEHASKKVNFALFKNIAHEHKDYQTSLQSSPAVPFDSKKKPSQGVLKPAVKRLHAADFFAT